MPAFVGHRGRTVGLVTMLTILVSVFGYLRDASLAARFGVSATMDAYFGAIFVPSNLYLILVVGTLSPVFIPILLQEDASDDRSRVSETFSVVMNFILLVMIAAVTCGVVTAHRWLPLLFPGFDRVTSALAVRLIYIILPAIVFLALTGIFTAVLNAYHKFALAAFAPALSSVAIISAALLVRGERAIYGVGIATTIGFMFQCFLLLPAVARLGVGYRPIFNFRHPAIAQLLRLGGPLLLYLALGIVSLLVERNLASRLSAGAVSAITYAIRLFAVPSGFLTAPLAIVSYPHFAREAVRRERGDLRNQISRTLRMVMFLFLPITIWVVLNALPVTRLLYERGQFRTQDSVLISRILMLYGIGILPNAIAMILIRGFYAIQDTLTPLVAESINLAFYTITATWLTSRFGIGGLAITRGLTFFLVAAIFGLVLWKRRGLLRVDLDLLRLCAQTAIATIAMATVSWLSLHLLQSTFDSGKMVLRLCVLGIVLITSATAFLATAHFLRVGEAGHTLSLIRDLIGKNRRTRTGSSVDREFRTTSVESQ